MNWVNNTDSDYPWRNIDDIIKAIDVNNIQPINGVLRNTPMIHLHQLPDYYKSYESDFLDLLSAHNSYLHCPDLSHVNSIGVRGENTII